MNIIMKCTFRNICKNQVAKHNITHDGSANFCKIHNLASKLFEISLEVYTRKEKIFFPFVGEVKKKYCIEINALNDAAIVTATKILTNGKSKTHETN